MGEFDSPPNYCSKTTSALIYVYMQDHLFDLADKVTDEASFVEFIKALALDRAAEKTISTSPYGPGANGWENGNIETFLEAASAWACASRGGLVGYDLPSNPWKRCADIFLMGKHYE